MIISRLPRSVIFGWLVVFLVLSFFPLSHHAQPRLESTGRIVAGRWFSEPLSPTASPTEPENEAILQALSTFAGRKERDDFSGPTRFLADHPNSVWAVALQTNLGLEYFNTGYYSRAIAAWENAWNLGK